MCLDGKRNDQMAFHALADYQNHVIGWLQWEQSALGDGAVVRFPRIWMSSGECRLSPMEKSTDRLMEIVSKPDLRSAEEAGLFVRNGLHDLGRGYQCST